MLRRAKTRARSVLAGVIVSGLVLVAMTPVNATTSQASLVRPDPGVMHFLSVQETLADLGFYRGPLDGEENQALRAAVLAFHKATGSERTESWGRLDWARVAVFTAPVSGGEDRFEIDLANQVAYLVRSGEVNAILGISSGNGASYRRPQGGVGRAVTPTGEFEFERFINGLRVAPLGVMYRPWYFWGGFAVHGSPSVPAYPASHGCIRVNMWDADWLAERLELGMSVIVSDGQPAGDLLRTLPDEELPALLNPTAGGFIWG